MNYCITYLARFKPSVQSTKYSYSLKQSVDECSCDKCHQVVDKSLKRASFNGIFHDIKGVQWVWSDNVRGYISNIGGYSTPHKKLRENTDRLIRS